MAQKKEQIKTPEKELNEMEISNLSGAEFKTLVIRMLTEMVEYGHKIKEKAKAMQSEVKGNIQGTNSDRKEMDSNQQCGPEGRKKHSTRTNEDTRIQKKKRGV